MLIRNRIFAQISPFWSKSQFRNYAQNNNVLDKIFYYFDHNFEIDSILTKMVILEQKSDF